MLEILVLDGCDFREKITGEGDEETGFSKRVGGRQREAIAKKVNGIHRY